MDKIDLIYDSVCRIEKKQDKHDERLDTHDVAIAKLTEEKKLKNRLRVAAIGFFMALSAAAGSMFK